MIEYQTKHCHSSSIDCQWASRCQTKHFQTCLKYLQIVSFLFFLNALKILSTHLPYLSIFSTLFSVFHLVMKHCISCLIFYMKHREESWKYDAQRSMFDELRGVSSGDETLCRMFDISSQTKSFLKDKLRMQILSSVSSNFQTLIKH